MDSNNIKEALDEICKDVRDIMQFILSSEVGINDKVGFNTLENSHLAKDFNVKQGDVGIISFFVNEEIDYIERGRRKGAKQPPLEALVEWAREHNISTDNGTLYAIAYAISRDGIKPRPIMENVWEMVESYWDEDWSDRIFEDITKELDNIFDK